MRLAAEDCGEEERVGVWREREKGERENFI
jgi:hypothetical protein